MMKHGLLLLLFVGLFSLVVQSQQQMQNAGFEAWEDVGLPIEEPVDWSSIKTSDNTLLNPSAPEVWGVDGDAHSGNYCLHLFNVKVEIFNVIATGMITSGRVHAEVNPDLAYTYTDPTDGRWNMPLTGRPDSLAGWYKASPAVGDFPTIDLILHTGLDSLPGAGLNVIGRFNYDFPSVAKTEWTRFSIPINYVKTGTPEYVLVILTSGNGTIPLEGSEVWFDDLEFIYTGSSVEDVLLSNFRIYYNANQLVVKNGNPDINEYSVFLTDMTGRTILTESAASGPEVSFGLNVKPGLYLATIHLDGHHISKKIIID